MTRRSFLGRAAAMTAAMTLDPERLLWVPGQKTFFLPSQAIVTATSMAEALELGFIAVIPNGHGGWARMEIRVDGANDGLTHVERLQREHAAVAALGGRIVRRVLYTSHTVT